MSIKHFLVLFFVAALCACSSPSEEAIQRAIAQTENAASQVSDSAIQTAIAKTQAVSGSIETAEPDLDGNDSDEVYQDCDVTTPYHEDWYVVFCDTFEDNRNGWELGSDSGDLSSSLLSMDDGKLVIDLSGKNNTGYLSGVIQWWYFGVAENFVVTLKGDVFSDYKSHSWGIIFNEADYENLHAFMINNSEGSYYLTKLEDGDQKFPISGKSSGAIDWDQQNELTIVAEDGYYQFYINGEFVNDYETNDIPGTNIAIAIWTAEGATARFEFDDLLFKTP